jgi:hypothetical protein
MGFRLKSYIKLFGPPILDALKALEKLAVETPEVCIMNTFIELEATNFVNPRYVQEYFHGYTPPEKRCDHIVSRSGESLGEYDFYFEWFIEPNQEHLRMLIGKIDAALKPTGIRYTITTR